MQTSLSYRSKDASPRTNTAAPSFSSSYSSSRYFSVMIFSVLEEV